MKDEKQDQNQPVEKIEGTAENWENGKLGRDEAHARLSSITISDLNLDLRKDKK